MRLKRKRVYTPTSEQKVFYFIGWALRVINAPVPQEHCHASGAPRSYYNRYRIRLRQFLRHFWWIRNVWLPDNPGDTTELDYRARHFIITVNTPVEDF